MPLPFIPFAFCVEAAVRAVSAGQQLVNTLGFRFGGGGGPLLSDYTALANALDVNLALMMSVDQTPNIQYTDIYISDLSSAIGPTFDLPINAVGVAAGARLPNQVAMTITFQSGLRGRSLRGRNYIFGLQDAGLADAAHWSLAETSAIQTIYTNMAAACLAISWQHVILSRRNAGARRLVGVATPVLNYRANAQVATQRDRLVS